MTSLAQVADALQHALTEVAAEAAREVGFVRRQRVVTGAGFVQALVLGWLGQPDATLHPLTQALALTSEAISPQGLAQRFTPEAAALLERVLGAAVRAVITSAPAAMPLLTRFTGVSVLDSTTLRLADALASVWPGCGGRVAAGAQAALKLQVRLDLGGGRLEGPALLAGRTHDQAGPLHAAPVPPGALLLRDLGFWSLARLRAVGEQGAYWLSRLHPQTVVLDAAGARCDLPRWLRRQPGVVDAPIQLGVAARLPARLLAARVPKAVADARRRKRRAAAKREGKQPPQATVAWRAGPSTSPTFPPTT